MNQNVNKKKDNMSTSSQITRESSPVVESKCKKHNKNIKNKNKTEIPTNDKINERVDKLEKNLSNINENISKLMSIIPVVNELKGVIDNQYDYNDDYISGSDQENEDRPTGIDDDGDELDYFREVTGLKTTEGPKIDPMIASGITNILTSGFVNKDTKNHILDKYDTPANCPRLAILECNPEIFKKVRNDFKLKDKELQFVQGTNIKSLTIQAYAFDKMNSLLKNPSITKEIKQELNDIFTCQSDALSMSAHASHQLDIHRRKNFKPELKEELASVICNDNYPLKDHLFGELTDKLKDVSDNLKTSQNLRRHNYRFKPYYNSYRNHFLGRRPSASNVRGGRGRRYQNQFQRDRPFSVRNQKFRIRNRKVNQ